MNKERQEKAANALEELEAPLKEIVRLLRDGQSDKKAHALLYEFRWRIGRVVSLVATSVGPPLIEDTRWAKDILDAQIWNNS